MVSVCTVPAKGGRSCEHFGGYKTINRIPLPLHSYIHTYIHTCIQIYTHSYIHTYIHTHIHTYIHTYIHINVYGEGFCSFGVDIIPHLIHYSVLLECGILLFSFNSLQCTCVLLSSSNVIVIH